MFKNQRVSQDSGYDRMICAMPVRPMSVSFFQQSVLLFSFLKTVSGSELEVLQFVSKGSCTTANENLTRIQASARLRD